MKKSWIFLCLFLLAHRSVISVQNPIAEAELRMQSMFKGISANRTDELNHLTNDSIATILEATLRMDGAFEYPFDSLTYLGKITSPDKKIRIFTWNLALKDGNNLYYGFILQKTDNRNLKVHRLTDRSSEIENPATAKLDADNWLGCLIYDIIENKTSGGENCYTLLGYDPENIFITRKLVDVLWFDNDKPVFGYPIFRYNNKLQNRIIFDYSAKVKMSLTWNKPMKMIVFDHLSPSSSVYTGNFQYYGPDFTYDALKFEKNIWELVKNVDVRNNGNR